MGGFHFLNLEYILVRVIDFLSGIGGGWDTLPGWLSGAIQNLLIIGMGATILLIIMIVYAQIRLLQVEHAGFHEHEEHDLEVVEPEVMATHTNGRWDRIVELASSGSESDWRRAVLEADIMLGDVLGAAGYPGATVGEQLKHANPIQMTTLDLAWKAHKMRNDIAHGGETLKLTERDVRTTIDYFKRVFEEFDAI